MDRPISVLIATAIPPEQSSVLEYLSETEERVTEEGTRYRVGTVNINDYARSVAVATVGMGNTKSGFETERAINYFEPNIVLFIGVAGGLREDDVRKGDVVAASKAYYYESGKADEDFLVRTSLGQPSYKSEKLAESVANEEKWQRRVCDNWPDTDGPDALVAPVAVGEKVVSSKESKVYDRLRTKFSDAVAVEMEGYGFYEATRANPEVDSLAIRGVSDMVEDKSEADELGWQEDASANAAAFAFELLRKKIRGTKRKSVGSSTPLKNKYKVVGFDLDGTLLRGFDYSWKLIWEYLDYPDEMRQKGFKMYERNDNNFDYKKWCEWCVQKFKKRGIDRSDFSEIVESSVEVTKNLRPAIGELKENGITTAIVSGGVDVFLKESIPDCEKLFDYIFINRFKFDESGNLCGIEPTDYDFDEKLDAIREVCVENDVGLDEASFVGENFNDVRVSAEVGLSIAYPDNSSKLREVTDVQIKQDNLLCIVPHIVDIA